MNPGYLPPTTAISSFPSPGMEEAVFYVENIINYSFKNKRLLEEALTHSSFPESTSYQRLEFLGDVALGLALSNYLFLSHPQLDPGQLSLLRAANVSTEKLARVAVKHGFYRFLRRNAAGLDDIVREFAEAVSREDNTAVYGGSIKAPKVLADVVESIAAAIYIDVNFDLRKLWMIFRGLLEPIVTLEELKQQPQPVTMLFKLCHKRGKQVDIKHWKKHEKNIASVYVDGVLLGSASSKYKETAKLDAAREALDKLSKSMLVNDGMSAIFDDSEGKFEIEAAKMKLHELCGKKKWPKPTYKIEKDKGPSHDKKFLSSVQIATSDGVLCITGDEKSRVKDAENSAASMMLHALRKTTYLLNA